MDGIGSTKYKPVTKHRRDEKRAPDVIIKKLIRKRRHNIKSFRARMAMEHAAQDSIEARLAMLELQFRNKTRKR